MGRIKPPSTLRILLGSATAYWLSDIINPGFVAIAVLIVLFCPVFYFDKLTEEPDELDDFKIPTDEQVLAIIEAKEAEAAALEAQALAESEELESETEDEQESEQEQLESIETTELEKQTVTPTNVAQEK